MKLIIIVCLVVRILAQSDQDRIDKIGCSDNCYYVRDYQYYTPRCFAYPGYDNESCNPKFVDTQCTDCCSYQFETNNCTLTGKNANLFRQIEYCPVGCTLDITKTKCISDQNKYLCGDLFLTYPNWFDRWLRQDGSCDDGYTRLRIAMANSSNYDYKCGISWYYGI